MTRYLRVKEVGEKSKLLPLEDDNTLLLSTLSSAFPRATGLEFSDPAESEDVMVVRLDHDKFFPPSNALDAIFRCIFPKSMKLNDYEATMESVEFQSIQEYLQSMKLTSNHTLRRRLYVHLSNLEDVKKEFKLMLHLIEKYFSDNCLNIPEGSTDILCTLKNSEVLPKTSDQIDTINVELVVNDQPFSVPIIIEEKILEKHNRTSATITLKEVGCQHIILDRHMIDSSAPGTNSEDDIPPPLKRLRTCQKKKHRKLQGELSRHQKNSSPWTDNILRIDVLIFLPDAKICLQLAQYLGVIFIEHAIVELEESAPAEEILQWRTSNERAKTYGLFQNYINEKLMMGCHQIGVTANYNLFHCMKSNVKALIFRECDYDFYSDVPKYAYYEVKIRKNPSILDYITGLGEIEREILNVDCNINVLYKENDKFYEVKLPLFSVIPFYIINFYANVLKSTNCNKLSFNSLQ